MAAPIKPLTEKQLAVLEEMVARGGTLLAGDASDVAEACDCSESYIYHLMRGNTDTARRFQKKLNERLQRVPLANPVRQVAYLQTMLEERMERRRMAGQPLTDKDPADLIKIAHSITKPSAGTNVNISQTNVDAKQIFDLSDLSDNDLRIMVQRVQDALSQGHGIGDIIDVEALPVEDADAE